MEQPLADQLRDAALKAFAAQGFDRASLKQIAGAVGVNESLIVHKFGSKLGLWRAAIDDFSHRLLDALDDRPAPPLDASRSADGRLAWAMAQIIDIVCDTPYLAPFAVHEVAHQDDRFDYFYDRLVKPIRDALQPLIVDAHRAGFLGEVDPDFHFVTFAGALLMSVVSRSILVRLSAPAASEAIFRRELKKALLASLAGT